MLYEVLAASPLRNRDFRFFETVNFFLLVKFDHFQGPNRRGSVARRPRSADDGACRPLRLVMHFRFSPVLQAHWPHHDEFERTCLLLSS